MRGNSVNINGRITRDAEIRRTQSGTNAVSWGIAWNSSKKNDQGGWDNVPHYFDVECWASDKQLAVIQPSIVKGARCAIVDGHLEYQSWEKEGQKRSKVVVRVDDPINGLLVSSGGVQQAEPEQQDSGFYDEDIPF